MSTRTTETTITFKHPFVLTADLMAHPAGTYRLVIDEEEILGLTFLAYRRAATMLHIPAINVQGLSRQVLLLESDELEAALEADGHALAT
ncbi:hypothetical protein HDIA_1481 [Hartmannibacter diazotrophicus]|uniref:Uncharacterized protein n=1 Tax=Hartmannibacter diazotrophicus TaxID=1482074 RepID=A0A2C9D3Z3_9HYPH|nr:hypothetical protein [Hartmannibacter diazotrophicus]SON55022.1 hypothetical protein HDIA_1481 [Hartmannibacter diazotrophicus]